MKKIVILVISFFLICGCQNVEDMQIDEIISFFSEDIKTSNVYRTGYKYYLPSGMQIDDSDDFIEEVTSLDYIYYMYVDVVSYYNQVGNVYEINSDAYYSKKYEINDKISYLEINITENDKYLIEIMYNYAKIEVIVDKQDINVSIINAVSLLNNIVYNDEIIENYLGDDILNFSEEEFDLFSGSGTNNTFSINTID